MPLQSDLYLNPTPLHSSSVSASTNQVNEQLIARGREIPKWFEVRPRFYNIAHRISDA